MQTVKLLLHWLLGILFVLAGVNHFLNADFYVRIMPPYLPWHLALVLVSGVAEVALGVLLLVRQTKVIAAWGLIALLIAVFPANIQMALNSQLYPEIDPAALWFRLPLQGVLIAWAYWYTRPLPFLVRLGWATARVPNPDPRQAVGRVYLLRGQGILFSRGFGRMCDELRRAGWWAEDLRCVGDAWLERHLSAEHRAGRLHGPVVFVGHSYGGRSALETARRLEPRGIAVRLIVCVDVAFPSPVPANVERAIHLYRSRLRLYPASALCAAPGSPALIENIDLDAADSPLRESWLHHLNITARPAVQAWILERIVHYRDTEHPENTKS